MSFMGFHQEILIDRSLRKKTSYFSIIIIITQRLLHLFYYLEVPCKGFKPRLRAREAVALLQQDRNEVGHRFFIRIPKGVLVLVL